MPHFKDPIQPRERLSSYDFVAPTKEKATTGKFMSAGDKYGVGFRQPVGKLKVTNSAPTLPMERKSFNPDEAILDV